MTATAAPPATKQHQTSAPGAPPDSSKPAAMSIPKEGYFELDQGRYGPVYPQTPACYGFTIIAKIKPGTEQTIREYGNKIESTIRDLPDGLAVLQLHYLRWVLFDVGGGTHFLYYGIFYTHFYKKNQEAVLLFSKNNINNLFQK